MVLNRRFRTLLLVSAIAVTPSADTTPTPVPVLPPAGTAAWRSDPRDLPDPWTTAPSAVHARLTGFSAVERRDLVADYPEILGNLDGTPVELRYAANERAMRAAGIAHPDGDYLVFDPRGRGRIAQVFGDLSTARRITVLVPGMSNRLANFWRGVGGLSYRSPASQAEDLQRATTGVAVIAWLGYDTPNTVGEAARDDLAQEGAAELVRLVQGLVAVRPDATIALFGHSYGSTVIGRAAPRLPAQVTDIAVFGSPGMDAGSAAELGTGARIWAGQSARDWIKWVPPVRWAGLGHGRRPSDPAFGARLFRTADVSDHDHYLAPGTDSFVALAAVAEGSS